MDKCNCYHEIHDITECWGTRERDLCSCGGDEAKCDYYPEKRAAAQARKFTEKFNGNKEMEVIKNAIHCLKVGADMAVCEECTLYECDHTDVEDIARVAIKALEKQIPKKPIENDYYDYACPNCGSNVVNQADNDYLFEHCYHCGQSLNWD